ncbi:hypothetical protein D3C72_1908800 [compost metagenome]
MGADAHRTCQHVAGGGHVGQLQRAGDGHDGAVGIGHQSRHGRACTDAAQPAHHAKCGRVRVLSGHRAGEEIGVEAVLFHARDGDIVQAARAQQ